MKRSMRTKERNETKERKKTNKHKDTTTKVPKLPKVLLLEQFEGCSFCGFEHFCV